MMQIDRDRFNEVFEDMCENYCVWPGSATSDETLKLHCEECPLNNIECDDYWEGRDDG